MLLQNHATCKIMAGGEGWSNSRWLNAFVVVHRAELGLQVDRPTGFRQGRRCQLDAEDKTSRCLAAFFGQQGLEQSRDEAQNIETQKARPIILRQVGIAGFGALWSVRVGLF